MKIPRNFLKRWARVSPAEIPSAARRAALFGRGLYVCPSRSSVKYYINEREIEHIDTGRKFQLNRRNGKTWKN